ncbi:uncharacterized [Tachysurus ichikawai]
MAYRSVALCTSALSASCRDLEQLSGLDCKHPEGKGECVSGSLGSVPGAVAAFSVTVVMLPSPQQGFLSFYSGTIACWKKLICSLKTF